MLFLGDKKYILCEQWEYDKHKGRIVHIEVLKDGYSEPSPAFEPPYHVAFPYTIEYDGHVYCVPESTQTRQISLYEIDGSPDRWRKISTLVSDCRCADPAIIQYSGEWWLFSTWGGKYAASNLFIWHSSSLLGPWVPHECNPISRDMRPSRSAGTPFVVDGVLYRPTQDCSRGYGSAVSINRVVELSSKRFVEERAIDVPPYSSPYSEGLHTMSSARDRTLLDGRHGIFSLRAFGYGVIDAWKKRKRI